MAQDNSRIPLSPPPSQGIAAPNGDPLDRSPPTKRVCLGVPTHGENVWFRPLELALARGYWMNMHQGAQSTAVMSRHASQPVQAMSSRGAPGVSGA